MAVLASLCLSLLPQVLQGSDIKLPPKTAAERPKEPAVRPLTEIERFRRDLLEMQGPPARVDQRLQEMAAAYAGPAMEALILEVARSARANEMQNLMVVARRFGGASPRVADELLFQLLARPLAEATRPVVETMAVLKGDAKKAALRECIRGRIPAARRHAVEVLVPMLRPEDDLAFALELSRDQALDLQMRGIELLGAMPVEASAARLCELLAKDMALAGVASQTLVAMGTAALPSLQAVLAAPPVDRRFAYAAFTTARIAEADSRLLPENLAPALVALLADPEILTRSLVAVPLADLMFRGVPALAGKDVAVVEALLEVVQPTTFVPNPDLLRRPTEDRLVRATGRLLGGESLPWRDWWKDQQAGFVSVRARVEFTDADALLAVVSWRQEGRHVRLLAEGFVDLAPMKDATEVVLSKSEMLELLAALQAGGLHDEVAMRVGTGLPRQRCLALQFPQGRTQVTMPLGEHPRFDALVAAVQKRVDEQLWQLYRDPQKEADRGAFWRAERAYREANPGAIAHGRRFVGRVLAQWPTLAPMLRAKALDFVANHQDRKQLLTESDGEVALALLGKLPELGDLDLRLLELVAGVPGDRVWRGAVKLAAQRQGTMRNAGRAVFAVLGPDAVLASLQDANPLVRQAGVREIMIVRDLRAADRLVELLADDDLDVRLVAAEACGHMQIPAAGKRLVDLIVADGTDPLLRRISLRALGRVGGDMAFPVLQRALLSKSADDKDAAMRGLGELRDPRAAHVLADLAVLGHGKDLGALARLHLQRQPGMLAIPAVRAQMQIVQDKAIRADLVLLVGGWHDAAGVPDLMDLLREPKHAPIASVLLEGATGLSFAAAQDRIDMAEQWYRANKQKPQWQWLLDALRADKVPTSLLPEQFAAEAGLVAVPELARLLVEAPEGRFWALSAAVLRSVTGEDFGAINAQSPTEAREAVAARYRIAFETGTVSGR